MMNPGCRLCLMLLPAFWFAGGQSAQSQSFDLHGQTAAWALYNDIHPHRAQLGLRLLPGLYGNRPLSGKWQLDTELSLHSYAFHTFTRYSPDRDLQLKPYRLWVRLSRPQMELRLGLQKINFGSAMLVRPLMWFDRIDARDPLQLTDGVYGALARYYFLNNANIWLWGLYGNDTLKGWEILASAKNSFEYGGRVQWPLAKGEIGLTGHWRHINTKKGYLSNEASVPEQRWAVDGKWDLGVGLWFESVLIHRRLPGTWLADQAMTTLGADYTFSWGRGLYVLTEYMQLSSGRQVWPSDDHLSLSALSLRYPVGLLDMVQLLYYYDWNHAEHYRLLNWSRTYDRWQLILMAFWNPRQFLLYQHLQDATAFSGNGLQGMIVFTF